MKTQNILYSMLGQTVYQAKSIELPRFIYQKCPGLPFPWYISTQYSFSSKLSDLPLFPAQRTGASADPAQWRL